MSRHRRHIVEMNVVPYIDVMLVLLVIFMVTSPLMSNESKQVDTTEETSEILLKIDLKGYINILDKSTNKEIELHKTIDNGEETANLIKEIMDKHQSKSIVLEPDKDITFGRLEDFMIVLQSKDIKFLLQ